MRLVTEERAFGYGHSKFVAERELNSSLCNHCLVRWRQALVCAWLTRALPSPGAGVGAISLQMPQRAGRRFRLLQTYFSVP